MCLVKFSFWKWACDSFGFGHESFSGFGVGASLVSWLAQHEGYRTKSVSVSGASTAGRCLFFTRLNLRGEFNHSDRRCIRTHPGPAGRWPKIRPLKSDSQGDRDEGGQVPLLRGCDEEERQDQGGDAEVEVPGLRGFGHGLLRRHGGEARGVPGVAHLQGHPALDARAGAHVQEEDRRVLARLADARADRRGPPGALRRRDLARPRPRGADRPRRGARGVVVHGAGGGLEGLGGPDGADPGPGGGGVRRRDRVRERAAARLAGRAGAEVPLPRVLAGEEVHDLAAEAPGGQGALRPRDRAHAPGHAPAGGLVGGALPAVVRVLGGLPRGRLLRGREARARPREAQEGEVVALAARLPGDALHLPGPRARLGGPAAAHQQRHRGRGQRPAARHAQEPPRHVGHAAREGGLLVVLPAHGFAAARARHPRVHADRRRHRPPLQDLLGVTEGGDGGPEWGDRAVWEELHRKDPYPFWLD